MSKAKPYELEWEGCGTIQSVQMHWPLDASARLTVRAALSSQDRKNLSFAGLPTSTRLKCQGKALFHGTLRSVRSSGVHTVDLEFRDPLDLLTRTYESEFVKGQKLEDFLSAVAKVVGLRPRFFGRFDLDFPGTDLGGLSYFEHLVRLSTDYGFYFTVHSSASELLFIALGAYRESAVVDKIVLGNILSRRSGADLFGSAETRSFDSQQGQARQNELSPSSFYESLGFLKEAASFDSMGRWDLAAGRMEEVAPRGMEDPKHRQLLSARLSKRASGAEKLTLTVRSPIGLPGDRVELKGLPEKALNGKYLVLALNAQVASSAPTFDVTVARA